MVPDSRCAGLQEFELTKLLARLLQIPHALLDSSQTVLVVVMAVCFVSAFSFPPLPNAFPFELGYQFFLLQASPFHRITGPTEQLQVIQVIGSAFGLGHNMVNGKVPELE